MRRAGRVGVGGAGLAAIAAVVVLLASGCGSGGVASAVSHPDIQHGNRRVHLVTGPARRLAVRVAQTLTEEAALDDFDYAYACEALARAHAARRAVDEATTWRDRAATAATKIADEEDREIFAGDLAAEPWYGVA